MKVGEILVQAGLIDEVQLRAALGDQSNWGQRLGVTLVKMGLLEERDLVRALGQQLQLPVVQLEGKRVQPEVLELVSQEFAEKHMCVPLFLRDRGGAKVLHLGMEDPCDLDAIDEIGFRTGLAVQPVIVSPSELCEAIDRFYGLGRDGGDGPSLDVPEDEGDLDLVHSPTLTHTGVADISGVEESLFPDIDEIRESKEAEARAEAQAEARPEAEVAPSPPTAPSAEETNRTILRALCHLLIDKQVITREELHALVRSISEDPPVS